MKNLDFPKYVNDFPIGEDLFEGKSQDKVADNIVSYLKENTKSKKRVVGIDGEWGSGKSNVIEIIRKKTANEFHIFTFDAWGHQEDLTRRTFLEELTDDLIKNKLLSDQWSEKLKTKLATNKITITQNTPEFNSVLVVFVLLILLSPIIKMVFEYVFVKNSADFPGLYSALSTLGFIVIFFIICWFSSKKENRPTLGKLFYLYKGQQIKTSKHETITSLEPSVREFRSILNEIISNMEKPAKKLIFVFDNMDRLPVKKVKEIWSSIHTFFAEVESNKFDSWVLIPYDEKHICKVFNDEQNSNNDLTVSYIQKTFSIVFRIAPPILSDWKQYFESKFKEAFDYSPPPQEQLANLFDYLHNDFTIKPRQILDYINNLVVLNKQWKDQIPLRYCGLFTLTKNLILENPVKVIIERSFIKNVESIFAGDLELEKYISSLVFNVEINKADEVLLRRNMEKALRGENDLKTISNHPAFISVLDSCFYNTDVNVEISIDTFNDLPDEIKKQKAFEKYWKQLTLSFMKNPLTFPNCENKYKTLFINLSNEDLKDDLLNFILNQIINIKNEEKYLFRGSEYSKIMDSLNNFFISNKINLNIFNNCSALTFTASEFVSFVGSCEKDYKTYKVICSEEEVNELLITETPSKISSYHSFLDKTKTDFDYTILISTIESQIISLTTSVPNYQNVVDDLLTVYKLISSKKPHSAKIPTSQAWAIFIANVNQPKAIDLIFTVLSDTPTRPSYFSNANTINLLSKNENVEYAASIAEYYMDYNELIDLSLTYPYILLTEVVKSITFKSYGVSKLSIKDIISKYDKIKTELIKNDVEYTKALLNRLMGWKEQYTKVLNENEFSDIVSITFLTDSTLVSNNFTKITFEYANKFLLSKDIDEWRNAFNDSSNSYLFKLTNVLLDKKLTSFNQLPDSSLSAYKEVVLKFAKTNLIPSNIGSWDLLLDYFDGRKLKLLFKEIRDNYIYSSETVTSDAMSFFEKGLFAHGGLAEKDKIEDVIRKLIIPSINDNSSLEDVIFRNKEAVLKLIKQSKEYKEEIIDSFKLKYTEAFKQELEYFSSNLDFQFGTEKNEETNI